MTLELANKYRNMIAVLPDDNDEHPIEHAMGEIMHQIHDDENALIKSQEVGEWGANVVVVMRDLSVLVINVNATGDANMKVGTISSDVLAEAFAKWLVKDFVKEHHEE